MKRQYVRWLAPALLSFLIACNSSSTPPSAILSVSSTTVDDGDTLVLKAEAKGGSAQVSKIEFYQGTAKLGEDTSFPYELSVPLSVTDDTTLEYSAKVIASNNQTATSQTVGVAVKVDKTPPQVVLQSSLSTLNAVGAVTLTATALDNKGVVKVEFFKGTDRLGEDISPADGFSLVVNLSASDNGDLKYSARAYDKKGNAGSSAEIGIQVDIDLTKPSISLSTNKTSLNTAGSAILTATATDNKGIEKVEFYQVESSGDLTKLAEDTDGSNGYTHKLGFSAADNGIHVYSARALDAKSNAATSAEVSINVNIDATKPTVSLASSSTNVLTPSPVTLTATAGDDKGINRVEFYESGQPNPIYTDSDGSDGYQHTLNYTDADNRIHIYTARAFDTSANSADSDPLGIAVDLDTTSPVVSLEANTTRLTQPGTISLFAANNDNRAVTKLEFYRVRAGGDELLNLINNPAALVQHDVTLGSNDESPVKFYVKAYDAKGNSTTTPQTAVELTITKITRFEATPTSSLTVNSIGGNVDLVWSGEWVLDYTLLVNPSDGVSTTIPAPGYSGNTSARITLPANTSGQSKTYTLTLKAKAFYPGASDDQAQLTLTLREAPGSLDPSFGNVGKVSTAIGSAFDQANALVLQSDGKLVAAGLSSNSSSSEFALARYNLDGSLDSGFGSGGKTTTDFTSGPDQAHSLAIQSDGKIVAAGTGNGDFALARYNNNGTLDTTFGTGGKTITNLGSNQDIATSVALQSDGKIVLAGYFYNGNNPDFALARYNSNGTLDTSFGNGGTLTTDFGSSAEQANSLNIQSDGKLVVVGYSNVNGISPEFAVVRYNPDGTLDNDFGVGGKVVIAIGFDAQAHSSAIQSDGKIVVVGSSRNGSNYDFTLVRLTGNGSLDSGFGSAGKITTDLGSKDDRAYAVAIQNDGKIVVVGRSSTGSDPNTIIPLYDLALARYKADGSLDTTFDTDGKVLTAIGSKNDEARAVVIDTEGRVVVAGFSDTSSTSSINYDFLLVRYTP